MTAHTNCTHPATKAGRAACRKGRTVKVADSIVAKSHRIVGPRCQCAAEYLGSSIHEAGCPKAEDAIVCFSCGTYNLHTRGCTAPAADKEAGAELHVKMTDARTAAFYDSLSPLEADVLESRRLDPEIDRLTRGILVTLGELNMELTAANREGRVTELTDAMLDGVADGTV